MKKPLKILHTVEFYHPSVGGMQEVVKQLSERLAYLGHDVTVATTRLPNRTGQVLNGVKIADFEISGNLVRGITGDVAAYVNFLLNSEFDVVVNFAAQQWATDICLGLLDDLAAVKILVPTGFSGLYDEIYRDYFTAMKVWLRKYDANVFLSEDYRDINFARENNITNFVVIPNGAGEDEFDATENEIRQKLHIPAQDFLVLHVGSHTGMKGHREAIQIFRKADIRNATLLIIANSFGGGCTAECKLWAKTFGFFPGDRLKNKKLIIKSLTRAETVEAYRSADLFLFPSNVECSPLVLFECMASSTPFLSTDVGNAAEIVRWSQAGEILPTAKDTYGNSKALIGLSARMLEELYRKPHKLAQMGSSGHMAWRKNFTWEKISQDYVQLYYDILANRRSFPGEGAVLRDILVKPCVYEESSARYKYAVSCIGEPYGEVPALVRSILRQGFQSMIWGFGWRHLIADNKKTLRQRLPRIAAKLLTTDGWVLAFQRVVALVRGLCNHCIRLLHRLLLDNLARGSVAQATDAGQAGGFKLPFHAFGGEVILEDAQEIINVSKINVTFGYPRSPFKSQECLIPLYGGFWMPKHSAETARLFEDGKEVVFWSSEQDLITKVDYYLTHDDEREEIRIAGAKRAKALQSGARLRSRA